jgi:hypothetical protein
MEIFTAAAIRCGRSILASSVIRQLHKKLIIVFLVAISIRSHAIS